MGYAYILTHEGRPCVFYNHYFGTTMVDAHNSALTVVPAPGLGLDIRKLIHVRKTYLGGSLTVLIRSRKSLSCRRCVQCLCSEEGW